MNLIVYSFSENTVSINNLELNSFAKFIGENIKIGIISFYGYSKQTYYSEKDFKNVLTCGDFIAKIKEINPLVISHILLEVEDYEITITDAYQFEVRSLNIRPFVEKICLEIIKAELFIPHLDSFEGVFLLFDDGKLIETFTTYQEYMASDYDL